MVIVESAAENKEWKLLPQQQQEKEQEKEQKKQKKTKKNSYSCIIFPFLPL